MIHQPWGDGKVLKGTNGIGQRRFVLETRQASISMIQRRLRIGYNRAARMIERMERDGMVSAADGAKGREVLLPTGG